MSVQPPPLQVTETVIWKTVDGTDLKGDKYFLPRLEQNLKGAWFLYLHGGSWVSGRRDDYCRPLFQGILDRGGSVISLEYRLMPEATLLQVLQDIRDMESYMRKLTKGPVVIIGCSAGSYYAQYAAVSLFGAFIQEIWADNSRVIGTNSHSQLFSLLLSPNSHTLPIQPDFGIFWFL